MLLKNLYYGRYAHESLVLADFQIANIRPQWCQQFYTILLTALPPLHCSAIVYGNERGFSADVLVTDTARILGIPTVAELLNLYVDREVLPTILVAPSTYAVEHSSIQDILHISYTIPTTSRLGRKHTTAVVIPPAVDTIKFDPYKYKQTSSIPPGEYMPSNVYTHPKCKLHKNSDIPRNKRGEIMKPCIIVAFIARLAPGNLLYISLILNYTRSIHW